MGPTAVVKDPLRVKCPYCWARPGASCIKGIAKDGRLLKRKPHAARKRAAIDAAKEGT